MATSQNGWSVSPPLDKSPFPGTNVVAAPGVRQGEVATILHYVGQQFNNTVEKLVAGWCWGYANRAIIGSTVTSNHASATAIDLNAPKHPLGSSGTFSAAQVRQIHSILNYLEGAVRWGGDYSGRKDEMHFEINANAAKVSQIAAKIKGTAPPKPASVPSGSHQRVFLPASAPSWRVYPLNKAPVRGNEIGLLNPARFGGLQYDILGKAEASTVIIQTRDFGRVKIWVAPSTGAVIKTVGTAVPALPVATVKKGTWNVRTGAGVRYAVLGQAIGGQRYQVFSVVNGWKKIRFKGRYGYISPLGWV